ncbi:MAG: hypothetical protein JST32_00030 [Bacteroidetes bacterium]|nr:hypothetical protein [Bacteroidota bacterium]
MIREIVKPAGKTYTLNLPEEMIGKTVEVIAFEIDKTQATAVSSSATAELRDIKKKYSKYPPVSHENYKFDRDGAHDHE